MAQRFAAEGAELAICDVDPTVAETAEKLAAEGGGRVLGTVVDVADPAAVDAWVAGAHGTLGRVDALVNNAGIFRDQRIERLDDAAWQAVVDVNLRGPFACCRAVLPPMKQAGYGRILSLSSMSWRGNFGQTNYAASKAGVIGLARTLALEAAPHGITSNVIAPGLIDTQMLASMNAAARGSWPPVSRAGGSGGRRRSPRRRRSCAPRRRAMSPASCSTWTAASASARRCAESTAPAPTGSTP